MGGEKAVKPSSQQNRGLSLEGDSQGNVLPGVVGGRLVCVVARNEETTLGHRHGALLAAHLPVGSLLSASAHSLRTPAASH